MTTENYYHRKRPLTTTRDDSGELTTGGGGLATRLMYFGRRSPSPTRNPKRPPDPDKGVHASEVPDPAPKTGFDFKVQPLEKGAFETQKPATPPPRAPIPPERSAPVAGATWALLGLIALIGLVLRLREPLSSPIIGAEDPILHMERTWNLVQGQPIADYPPGLMAVLAPLTLFGPEVFYDVARWFPPFLGAGAVAAMFFLCRNHMHPAGALGASLLVAMMPELIFRSNTLMPTAFDLILVPVFLLAVLKVPDGSKWALRTAGAIALFLGLAHPWALVLVLVPAGVWGLGLLATRRAHRSWTVPAAAGSFLAFLVLVNWLPVWRPSDLLVNHAFPRAGELAGNPGSFWPLPLHVDFPAMITWAALLLGAAGAFVAFRTQRSRFGTLAIVWTLLLLPLILVDWFDIWYVPHRTVAYFAIGVVMLAGLAISEVVKFFESARPNLKKSATVGTLAVVAALMLPGALGVDPWYRVYNDDDFAAWSALDERGTPFLMAGSWESRAGYRATTGNPAMYSPGFFEDEVVRNFELQQHPDMVVVVDNETARNGHPTGFLDTWTLIGEWGDVRAYTPPAA